MYSTLKPVARFNYRLANRVIELHNKGYNYDFSLVNKTFLLCAQDNNYFLLSAVQIKVIDQQYDYFTHSFKYIHTVDIDSGEKGLLVTDCIVTNNAAYMLAG